MDNPSFPLFAAIFIWVKKIDSGSAALVVVWSQHHHNIHGEYSLRFANAVVDNFVTIDSVNDPLLIVVRFSTASSLAHHKITQVKHYCNWNVNQIKQSETLTTKLLKVPQTSTSPLRTPQSQPARKNS